MRTCATSRGFASYALREDLGVAYETAKSWLGTLARLCFLFELRPFAGNLARTLRHEAKVYLFDFTEVDDPGARFENLAALHLLKLVDAWNDRGCGDTHAVQLIRQGSPRRVDGMLVVPAERLLARI